MKTINIMALMSLIIMSPIDAQSIDFNSNQTTVGAGSYAFNLNGGLQKAFVRVDNPFDVAASTVSFDGSGEISFPKGYYGDFQFETSTDLVHWNDDEVVTVQANLAVDSLEIVPAVNNPGAASYPYDAMSVPFLTFRITASESGDQEISEMRFTRKGTGDVNSIPYFRLESNGFVIEDDIAYTDFSGFTATFNPPLIIGRGKTLELDLISIPSGSDHDQVFSFEPGFDLSLTDVVSTASQVVGENVEGSRMKVSVNPMSQIRFETLGTDSVLSVGDNFREIGTFLLSNSSDTQEAGLRRLVLTQSSVNDVNIQPANLSLSLENIALYAGGEQVSSETIINQDRITFYMSTAVTILPEDSSIFSVRADITTASSGDYINLKVEDATDITVVDPANGFGVVPVSQMLTSLVLSPSPFTNNTVGAWNLAEDDYARLRVYALDPGDISVSRDPSSLGNQDVAPGTDDVSFLRARVSIGQPVITDGIRVFVDDAQGFADISALNSAFNNWRLFRNGTLISIKSAFVDGDGDPLNLVGDYIEFDTTFEISGTSVLEVIGNIDSSVPSSGTGIKLTTNALSFLNPEYISTGNSLATTELLGSATASWVYPQESVLTSARSDGLSDGESFIAGIHELTALEFVLDNNNSGDVLVTSVTVQAIGTGAAPQYQGYGASIFVDGIQQGSFRNIHSLTGEATFHDLSVVISSDGQQEFVLVIDTVESIAEDHTDFIRFDVTNIDADNLESGHPVSFQGLPLQGATFDVLESGSLSVEKVNVYPESSILIAGQTDRPVAGLRLIAADDDIEIHDLYFINDLDGDGIPDNLGIGDRLDFALVDSFGNIIEWVSMVNGRVHCELANAVRIRVPQGGSKNVFVHADVRSITDEFQTGHQLRLVLDTNQGVNGLEARTAATGGDLTSDYVTVADPLVGDPFVVHRTALTFAHAEIQPVLATRPEVLTPGTANPIYRFSVSADSAYAATLQQVPLSITSTPGVLAAGGQLLSSNSLRLFRYSSESYTGIPTEISMTVGGLAPDATLTFVESEDIEAGETVYYELHTTEAIVDTISDGDLISVSITPHSGVLWTDRANAGSENLTALSGENLTYPSVSDGARE